MLAEAVPELFPNNATTADPTVDDDITLGYVRFSRWFNTTTGRLWTLLDNTDGAAVWQSGMDYVLAETLPANPFEGQVVIHIPTGRAVKMVYYGAQWNPEMSYGSMDIYVHSTGTDDLDEGTATGTDAFKTWQFAWDIIPKDYGGNVTLHASEETFIETLTGRNKKPTGNYTITILGTLPTADDSGTSTSGSVYSMGAAGDGAIYATLVDTSKSWGMGTLADSGTTDSTTASKLEDSTQNFLTTVKLGMVVKNTTDTTYARILEIESNTTLRLDTDIMVSGEGYEIGYGEHSNKLVIVNSEEYVIDANYDDTLHLVGVIVTTPSTDSYAIYDLSTGTTIDLSSLSGDEEAFTFDNQKAVELKYINIEEWHGNNGVYIKDFSQVSIYSCRFERSRVDSNGLAGIQVEGFSSTPHIESTVFIETGGTSWLRGIRYQQGSASIEGDNIKNIKMKGINSGVVLATAFQNFSTLGHGWVLRDQRAFGLDVVSSTRADIGSTVITGAGNKGLRSQSYALVIVRADCEISNSGSDNVSVDVHGEVSNAGANTQINFAGGYGVNTNNISFGIGVSTWSYTNNASGTYTAAAAAFAQNT